MDHNWAKNIFPLCWDRGKLKSPPPQGLEPLFQTPPPLEGGAPRAGQWSLFFVYPPLSRTDGVMDVLSIEGGGGGLIWDTQPPRLLATSPTQEMPMPGEGGGGGQPRNTCLLPWSPPPAMYSHSDTSLALGALMGPTS